MPKTLREYQKLALDFLLEHERANLFMGMGCGKTVSVLTVLQLLKDLASEQLPALIAAPKRVAETVWPLECAEWDHLSDFTVVPILGSAEQRKAALSIRADAYVINYENLPWLRETLGNKWPFPTMVCDESTRLKSLRPCEKISSMGKPFMATAGGKRAKAIGKAAYSYTTRWINLSGTPAPNGLQDLFAPQFLLDKGAALGKNHGAFISRWFFEDENTGIIRPRSFAFDQITEAIRPSTLTIKAEDYFDLGSTLEHKIEIVLPPKAAKIYEQMEDEMFAELKAGNVEALNEASKSSKCRQIASGAIYTEVPKWENIHDAKLEALESIMEEHAGAPVLVAYYWKHDKAKILKRFPKAESLDKDPTIVQRWNDGKIPMLVFHPKSAGHGLNLARGGTSMVFYSVDWNCEEHDQAIGRIGPTRQAQLGSKRAVHIYYIMARDTIDYTVKRRLETKCSVQEALLDAMKQRGSK